MVESEQAISTYCSLMALMEENLGETYKVSQETTVYYCDDEGSWVQLKPFNVAVIEMIRCAREVPGTDFKRIKVDDVELIMELVLAVSLEIILPVPFTVFHNFETVDFDTLNCLDTADKVPSGAVPLRMSPPFTMISVIRLSRRSLFSGFPGLKFLPAFE